MYIEPSRFEISIRAHCASVAPGICSHFQTPSGLRVTVGALFSLRVCAYVLNQTEGVGLGGGLLRKKGSGRLGTHSYNPQTYADAHLHPCT